MCMAMPCIMACTDKSSVRRFDCLLLKRTVLQQLDAPGLPCVHLCLLYEAQVSWLVDIRINRMGALICLMRCRVAMGGVGCDVFMGGLWM